MTNETEAITAKFDAGIRDANDGKFAADEELQAEFDRWRGRSKGSEIERSRSPE